MRGRSGPVDSGFLLFLVAVAAHLSSDELWGSFGLFGIFGCSRLQLNECMAGRKGMQDWGEREEKRTETGAAK